MGRGNRQESRSFVRGYDCSTTISFGQPTHECGSLTIGFKGPEHRRDGNTGRTSETRRPIAAGLPTTLKNAWLIWESQSCTGALWGLQRRERGNGLGVGGGNKHVKFRVFGVTEGGQPAQKRRAYFQLGERLVTGSPSPVVYVGKTRKELSCIIICFKAIR